MIDPALCGAHIDPAITDAVCLAIASSGAEPLFADAKPELAGFGVGKTLLHQDTEERLFGKTLPSWNQARGTCTEQGTGRAIQLASWYAADRGGQIGKNVEWASEMLYGVGRVQLGKGQFGRASPWGAKGQNDGCSPDLVAQAAHDFGWLPRGVYGTIDLSRPREDLAIAWGNSGTPASLLSDPAICKIQACMLVKSIENLRDGLAAGYAATCSGPFATEGPRDKDGCVALTDISPMGHCESITGVFVDVHGDLRFVIQNSWNGNATTGGGTWKLENGREVKPAEGAAAVSTDSILKYIRRGVLWLVTGPRNLPQLAV